jgi:glycosyltransferase involved in cell wall biosynthesis
LAFGGVDLGDYDVVLSNKSGFCHGVKVRPDAKHIDYCLTPTRYVWMPDAYLQREGFGKAVEWGMKPLVAWLKRWDYDAAQRVTHFVAISTEVQRRIRRYYHRESVIIFPPVDMDKFRPNDQPPEPFFFVLSRLIPYKRIDLAIQACNQVGCRLVVAGEHRAGQVIKTTVTSLATIPLSVGLRVIKTPFDNPVGICAGCGHIKCRRDWADNGNAIV